MMDYYIAPKSKWIVATYSNTDESPKRLLNDDNKSAIYIEHDIIY